MAKQRYAAAVSLGVMAVGFGAMFPLGNSATVHILQEGFKAGLVGGLADWFAVSALFRHPLGIPIPHTSLLVRNRKKITNALVSAVENELLNKESISLKLKQFEIVSPMLDRLEGQLETESFRRMIVSAADWAVRNLPIEPIEQYIAKEIDAWAESVDMRQLLQGVVGEITRRGYDEKALDYLLDRAETWTDQQETRLALGRVAMAAIEGVQLNGLMSFAVNAFLGFMNEDKLGGLLQNVIHNALAQMRIPEHPHRAMLLEEMQSVLRQIPDHPAVLAEGDEWKRKALGQVREQLGSRLQSLRDQWLHKIAEPAFAGDTAVPWLRRLLQLLRGNKRLIASLDGWVHEQLIGWVEHNHSKIGELVRENVDKLDNDALVRLLEEKVGGDLQWIRVNGAICGFLIGVVLTLLG